MTPDAQILSIAEDTGASNPVPVDALRAHSSNGSAPAEADASRQLQRSPRRDRLVEIIRNGIPERRFCPAASHG